jgi:hypothetical protein
MADTVSRKWSIVIAQLVMGVGMAVTGLVTAFPALVVTQMLWGLGNTFWSGADVAWVTDELDDPGRTARVLIAAARWRQVGAAVGMVTFGALAWASDLATSVVVAGVAAALLGPVVAARFTEHNFTPTREHRWRASASILRRGTSLARGDHQILVVLAATFLVNGGAEAFERLFAKRLVDLGLPQDPDPIVWFTALGLVTLAVAVLALRIVEARIDGVGAARRVYAGACLIGTVGLVLLAQAPDDVTGVAGVLLVGGIALSVTRAVGVIWVNRRTTSDVRATVQSFLSQAESFGEIVLGVTLGIVAQAGSITVALMGAGGLLAGAGFLVARRGASERGTVPVRPTESGG